MIVPRSRAELMFRNALREEVRCEFTQKDLKVWRLTRRRYPKAQWFYPSDMQEMPNPHIHKARLFFIARDAEVVGVTWDRVEKIAFAELRRHAKRGESRQVELLARAFELGL